MCKAQCVEEDTFMASNRVIVSGDVSSYGLKMSWTEQGGKPTLEAGKNVRGRWLHKRCLDVCV
jgi:hypothetical protein